MFVFDFDPWFPMTTISTTKKNTKKKREREKKKHYQNSTTVNQVKTFKTYFSTLWFTFFFYK